MPSSLHGTLVGCTRSRIDCHCDSVTRRKVLWQLTGLGYHSRQIRLCVQGVHVLKRNGSFLRGGSALFRYGETRLLGHDDDAVVVDVMMMMMRFFPSNFFVEVQ